MAERGETVQDPEELERAKATLVAFAEAMFEWEQSYWANRSLWNAATPEERAELDAELKDTCRAVFARYCTDKSRPGFRPESLSCRDPSDYDPKRRVVEGAEFDDDRRVFVYAKGATSRLRFTLVKSADQWLVDDCHWLRGEKWSRGGL